MTGQRNYPSPTAFRRAVTDRLTAKAGNDPWPLPALQRQFAYDRLLARLYLVDDGWIVKGATALLAREIGVRGTKDIDIFRNTALAISEADLRRAADLDLDDWCHFEAGPSQQTAQGASALRIPITLYIGPPQWAAFSVDLVGDQLTMTGEPDNVPPLARGAIPDAQQRGYRAYPLVDHVADKVVATFDRYGTAQLPSTRYKDLLDLVAITAASEIDATAQAAALTSEAARRAVHLPDRFDVPDRRLWEPGYAREARASVTPVSTTLDDALAAVRPFIDPLLHGSAAGRWRPLAQAWNLTGRDWLGLA